MERLTQMGADGWTLNFGYDKWDAFSRLAAYEDTGLEPEDVNTIKAVYVPDHEELKAYRELGSIDRLRDLAEADKDGRLVVLPCKVGDTVWFVRSILSIAERPMEFKVSSIGGFDREEGALYLAISTGETSKTDRRFSEKQIGEKVFLDKAKAEEKIKELREKAMEVKP